MHFTPARCWDPLGNLTESWGCPAESKWDWGLCALTAEGVQGFAVLERKGLLEAETKQ